MLAPLLYRGLHLTGLTALARRVRNAGVVLCYHNVVPAAAAPSAAAGAHMRLDHFRSQMRWLVAHYDVVPLSTFLDRLASGASMRRTASLTFDDAYAGVFEYAWPVLHEMGIVPTVFVIAGASGRKRPFWWDHPAVQRAGTSARRQEWLTTLRGDENAILRSLPDAANDAADVSAAYLPVEWRVIAQAVRAGVALGVHSTSHRTLPTLSDGELVDEIVTSRSVITRETGGTPDVFAFPYGIWDPRVREQVRQAGYRAALTLDFGLVSAGADPWTLPRVNVPSGISDPAYRAWAGGLNLRSFVTPGLEFARRRV
jgi:peptidoglycan/xylan/chitin deacetylase (PgdA/CDA1 family)